MRSPSKGILRLHTPGREEREVGESADLAMKIASNDI